MLRGRGVGMGRGLGAEWVARLGGQNG